MKNSLFIGIAGGSGSGKTTLANRLASHFGDRLSLIRHDDYYKAQSSLTLEERASLNFDHPDAFDTELLIRHLDELRLGHSVDCPVYDYSKHDRSDKVRTVAAAEVIVLEGILIFENPEAGVRYFWVKPSDVAIYVERGAADIGVAGKDILLEYQPDVFELLDLDLGKCRMAVAAKKDFYDDGSRTLRVATKFTNIAARYYASKCREIDIIHLNGSIEIAPILGLSDVIVDIVETGKTLVENDLEVKETILPISARLICNKAAFRFKTAEIEKITSYMKAQVEAHD